MRQQTRAVRERGVRDVGTTPDPADALHNLRYNGPVVLEQLLRRLGRVVHARIELHQPRAFAPRRRRTRRRQDKRPCPAFMAAGSLLSRVDQAVHPCRLRLEVLLLEVVRIVRQPLQVVAVRRVVGVERRIDLARIALLEDSRVQAAEPVDRHARVRVDEHESVGLRQLRQRVVALHELVRALTVRRPLLRHRLVEARRRTTAAVPEQHDPRDARLPAQELDSRLDVERVPPRNQRPLRCCRTVDSSPAQGTRGWRAPSWQCVRGSWRCDQSEDRDVRGRP